MTTMGISSNGVLATDPFGPASRQWQKLQRQQLQKPGGRRGLISPTAKVLPPQAPIMYFLAVASRRCDMQKSPEKLSGEPLSNSPQSLHAEARSSIDDRFVSMPEITTSRYADF